MLLGYQSVYPVFPVLLLELCICFDLMLLMIHVVYQYVTDRLFQFVNQQKAGLIFLLLVVKEARLNTFPWQGV